MDIHNSKRGYHLITQVLDIINSYTGYPQIDLAGYIMRKIET